MENKVSSWYFQKKKFRSQKSWDYKKCLVLRKKVSLNYSLSSDFLNVPLAKHPCDSEFCQLLKTLCQDCRLQLANTRVSGRGPRKVMVLCIGHCEQAYGEMHRNQCHGGKSRGSSNSFNGVATKPALDGSTFNLGWTKQDADCSYVRG